MTRMNYHEQSPRYGCYGMLFELSVCVRVCVVVCPSLSVVCVSHTSPRWRLHPRRICDSQLAHPCCPVHSDACSAPRRTIHHHQGSVLLQGLTSALSTLSLRGTNNMVTPADFSNDEDVGRSSKVTPRDGKRPSVKKGSKKSGGHVRGAEVVESHSRRNCSERNTATRAGAVVDNSEVVEAHSEIESEASVRHLDNERRSSNKHHGSERRRDRDRGS